MRPGRAHLHCPSRDLGANLRDGGIPTAHHSPHRWGHSNPPILSLNCASSLPAGLAYADAAGALAYPQSATNVAAAIHA